jgi:toxin-antitoxin system PIN domain toxin
VIIVDANVLVYAYTASHAQQHERARNLEEQLATAARVALPWSSLLAFVRLVTNARLFTDPVSRSTAWAQVQSWLDAEAAWIPVPTARHRSLVGACLSVPGLRANDVPDAELAALTIGHGLRLATADGGFVRFPQLEWFNPLA